MSLSTSSARTINRSRADPFGWHVVRVSVGVVVLSRT
jgi:hypothetical protein